MPGPPCGPSGVQSTLRQAGCRISRPEDSNSYPEIKNRFNWPIAFYYLLHNEEDSQIKIIDNKNVLYYKP